MVISDKEAFRVLGLPLGVDRDAIRERYKLLSTKYTSSKLPEDKRKLEQVTAAFSQLIPQLQRPLPTQHHQPCGNKNKNAKAGKNQIIQDIFSSDEEIFNKGKNNIKNGTIKNDLENKDRRKADKKKAKKKKQKEKKKQGKSENTPPENNYKTNEESNSESEDDIIEEVQGIDPNSAFVAIVGKKIGGTSTVNSSLSNINNNNNSSNSNNTSNNNNNINNSNNNENSNITNSIRNEDTKKIKNTEKSQVLLEARQIQSRQLAMRGNEEANKGEYKRAIHLFTEAIRLDPNDHRFFGNRSYCYGQLHQYIEALKDAEKAIKLSPEWPKGHFRKGRALKGLGRLQEGEEAFKQVLQYDPGCEDALQEITRVRKKRLVDMGFTDIQARAAIKKYIQVQPALDALLNGEFQNSHNIFFSDDDDDVDEEETVYQPPPKPKDVKMNPKNLEGLTSLWVGNVVPDVTEKVLTKLFSKYGHVTSVRQLKEKYCAFVNFADKKAAGNAMEGLQSCDLYGSKLLIKFPDNPIINGSQNIIIRKNPKTTKATTTNNSSVSQISTSNAEPPASTGPSAVKVRGPVNGDECYFWRTTGCGFADSCKYNHIPKNKGIDKKPWQK